MSKKGKIAAYIILVFCAIVVAVCIYIFVDTLIEYDKADSFYSEINGNETLPTDPEKEEYVTERIAFFDSIKKEYPNVVGYINIPSVSISYPVAQGDDNEYYMTHLVSGEESPSGSVFLDCHIAQSPSVAENFVLYGHSMNNKSMFYNIRSLFNAEIFEEAEVEYICDDGVYIFESFSVYVTTTADLYYAYAFVSDFSFLEFLSERLEKTRFVHTEDFNAESRLITLVTCTNSVSDPDERYVYHGILKNYYPRAVTE